MQSGYAPVEMIEQTITDAYSARLFIIAIHLLFYLSVLCMWIPLANLPVHGIHVTVILVVAKRIRYCISLKILICMGLIHWNRFLPLPHRYSAFMRTPRAVSHALCSQPVWDKTIVAVEHHGFADGEQEYYCASLYSPET